MVDYNAFRNSLNSNPLLRENVFMYNYNLGRFGTTPINDARLQFETNFLSHTPGIEPMITTYFTANNCNLGLNNNSNPNGGNNTNNSTRKSPNQKKLEKALFAIGTGLFAGGISQLTDVEATQKILEIYSGGATLFGTAGALLYGIKKRYE